MRFYYSLFIFPIATLFLVNNFNTNQADHRKGNFIGKVNTDPKKPHDIILSFNTMVRDGAQPYQLGVMASTDFSGKYNADAIKAAKWINITDRFNLASDNDNRQFHFSGKRDISDVCAEGKRIYIAFRYVTLPQGKYGRYRIWRINNFLLENSKGKEIVNQSMAKWKMVNIGAYEAERNVISKTRFAFRGNRAENTDSLTVCWIISKAIEITD